MVLGPANLAAGGYWALAASADLIANHIRDKQQRPRATVPPWLGFPELRGERESDAPEGVEALGLARVPQRSAGVIAVGFIGADRHRGDGQHGPPGSPSGRR